MSFRRCHQSWPVTLKLKLKPPLFSKMEKLSLPTISQLCMELTQSWGAVWQVCCRTWEALFRALHGLAVKEGDAM